MKIYRTCTILYTEYKKYFLPIWS